jgi:acyl-CoA synthetase (AMP-forming)/AMP-acid ligase II
MSTVHVVDPADVEANARRAAGWLAAQGLHKGDRVAVLADNDPRLIELTLGALRTGIVPVMVNEQIPEQDRRWMVDNAEPALVVENIAARPWARAPERDLHDVPLARPMFYTSGSTGYPKGVWSGVLSDADASAWADDEDELWSPEPNGTWLVCSPLHHSAGHRSATAALLKGCRVLLLDRFDADTVVRLLAEQPVCGTFLVPTHLRRIFELGDPPKPQAARRVLHAGEPCPDTLKRKAIAWLPDLLWEFYGSTEGQFTAISSGEWLAHPGSVGRARRGRALRVADRDKDGVGTVYVTSPPFARWSYWGDDEKTAAAWDGDAFTVGDLGRMDDGYLYLVSRRDDLIISGGVNVYPAVVERVLHEHPAVHDVAVVGVPDERWGEVVCAAIVADDVAAIDAWARERLDAASRPKRYVRVDAVPRTARGKVDREAMRTLASSAT